MNEKEEIKEENIIDFIARDIAQKTLNLWKEKPEAIRKKLPDHIHIIELQNRLTSILLFTFGMKAAIMGAGQSVGRAAASYYTLCCDVAEKIKKFREAKTYEEVENCELIKMLKELFEKTGLGILKVVKFEKDNYIVLAVEECVEAVGLPNIGKKVCYYMTGYLEGMFSIFFGKEVKGREVKCIAKGDEICEFEISVIE